MVDDDEYYEFVNVPSTIFHCSAGSSHRSRCPVAVAAALDRGGRSTPVCHVDAGGKEQKQDDTQFL